MLSSSPRKRGFAFLLTHKVAAIGLIGVAGVLLLAGLSEWGDIVQNKYQASAERARAEKVGLEAIHTSLLESRRSEKDFIIRSEMKFAERQSQFAGAAQTQLQALRAAAAEADADAKVRQLDQIDSGLVSYRKAFQEVVAAKQRLGLNENSGLEGTLRGSVHAIESHLQPLHQPALTESMLMMRRHEKDFMLRHDAKYGQDLARAATDFKAALQALSLSAEEKTELLQQLGAYERDFNAWMQETLLLLARQKTMSESYAAMEPLLDAAVQASQQAYAEALSARQEVHDSTALRMRIAAGVIIVLAGGFAFAVGRSIAGPIRAMTTAMKRLAEGQLDLVLPGLGRRDEIGEIATAVEGFKLKATEKAAQEADEILRRQKAEAEAQARAAEERAKLAEQQALVVRALAEGLTKLAQGDLTFRLDDAHFTESSRQIKEDFNAAIARLEDTIAALAAAVNEVTSTAGEIATSTTDLSQRTEEQAASLEQTSASMEQMSATVKKNAENAGQANTLAAGTGQMADRGGGVVKDTVDAMARIKESSGRISEIILVIDEIARQTNLLALNAAVEAARAGEAGRGFAVVASEVRTLAQRSAQAAKDIKELITKSASQVDQGVDLVSKAGTSLAEIVDSIKSVVRVVSEIAGASAEQATGIDQVNTALTQMDQVTQQNSALVEENAAAAKALQEQSEAMRAQVAFFTVRGNAVRSPGQVRSAGEPAAVAKPVVQLRPRPLVVAQTHGATALALGQESEWKEF